MHLTFLQTLDSPWPGILQLLDSPWHGIEEDIKNAMPPRMRKRDFPDESKAWWWIDPDPTKKSDTVSNFDHFLRTYRSDPGDDTIKTSDTVSNFQHFLRTYRNGLSNLIDYQQKIWVPRIQAELWPRGRPGSLKQRYAYMRYG